MVVSRTEVGRMIYLGKRTAAPNKKYTQIIVKDCAFFTASIQRKLAMTINYLLYVLHISKIPPFPDF